jgi:hypothetical protein
MPESVSDVKKIVIKLETRDQLLIAKWAEQQVWGYMENLQDDQKCCTECGAYEHQHLNGQGGFDPAECRISHEPVIVSHPYTDVIPEDIIEVLMGLRANTMVIRTRPKMVLDFLLNNTFYENGDFDTGTPDDFYLLDEESCPIPKPDEPFLSATMFTKIIKQLEE